MTFENWFGNSHPGISLRSVAAVLELVGEGATVPFMARYRKEKTGNLDEVGIKAVIDAKELWDEILRRKTFIASEIVRQGKMTDALKATLEATFQMDALEDIYLPYKQKRKTKAVLAREAGLEPLAEVLWKLGHGEEKPDPRITLETFASTFVNAEKGIKDVAAALQGAQDIFIEKLSETHTLREFVRRKLFDSGFVTTKKGEKAKTPSKFENYFSYAESAKSLAEVKNSHRYLALRRGWMEEELIASIQGAPGDETFESSMLQEFEKAACTVPDVMSSALLLKAAKFALKAHVLPSIESEVHKALKESADTAAIQVFAENVKNLLMASPYGPRAVLGVDPGIRTGCKLALVDASGKFIAHHVIMLQSENDKKAAREFLSVLFKSGSISAVAVGNGTAGRETETFVRETLKICELPRIPVVMISESGASVYSASDVAREEFPDLDATVRGAISIARRLQDPLAELVKVDPKSIGVGQYQHDVSQSSLKKSLDFVVDSCVNSVGVNLNTASIHLLARVSGIGPALAKSLVEHRGQKGVFKTRADLLEVPRFSKKVFEQAAGFLRIPDGSNPLDNTGVHPERYAMIEGLAAKLGKQIRDLIGDGATVLKAQDEFRKEVGEFTFNDIVGDLSKPGRDPRDEFVPFSYRDDIFELKDLKPNMKCPGIVTNVTNFGAFVDIGVHQDGLVHISHLADRFVKDPREFVKPGDHVEVRVLDVNLEKKQIALTMKSERSEGAQHDRSHSRDQEQRPSQGRGNGPRHEGPRAGSGNGAPPSGGIPRGAGGGGPRGGNGTQAPRNPRDGYRGGFQKPQHSGGGGAPSRSFDNRGGGGGEHRGPSGGGSYDRSRSAPPQRNDFKNNAFSQLAGLKDSLKALPPAPAKSKKT